MRILIIGSKGFIGTATTAYLKKDPGYKVYEADVVTDYSTENYFQIDATNADYKQIFRSHKFDWCINCSGAASVPDSYQNPARDYSLNVQNVAMMLNAIREEQPECKFIQLSSAAVYGNPETLPVLESAPLNPLSPYGIHKKQAEELCALYHKYFGIACYIVRIFSAYGPGLKKQLFWDLYEKTRKNGNISLFGTGNESRDFIYVNDIARALKIITSVPKETFGIYNLANGEEIQIRQVASHFLRGLNFKSDFSFSGEIRPGDPLCWKADISKIKDLGYLPETSFEKGVEKICLWLKESE